MDPDSPVVHLPLLIPGKQLWKDIREGKWRQAQTLKRG